ncbi:NAD(P)/FAD-dependent oxidoreductase [Arenibacter sp. GZD96]|uniref:phytoene desaturase family protein n=1 Tax=Aurantibrevibacter litoralis TaxID=3106030 RepID=UPI002AFF1998|nr:NAD(P)/FAD-dependent oxidoreductase [Arenibacter sp. GZD-96]MEA1784849.1 NAD(P)/FAD-dependent oxidoreductase [Arenibacter sp. GZD-96]
MENATYDAIVVGAGPNGLAAGIRLQQHGLSVLVVEGKDTIGGGMRTAELTLPGFKHDICSAIHPTALASPYLATLPLHEHGLTYILPEVDCAHPFDDGSAAHLERSIANTARGLGVDAKNYTQLFQPLKGYWDGIAADVLAPLSFPKNPMDMARFGVSAMQPATWLAKKFQTKEAKGLWAGMAAHSLQPLSNWATSGIGLVLTTAGHLGGWPIPKGGSQSIANAMGAYFESIGGKIETNFYVKSLDQLPPAKAILFDVTPKQLLEIAGHTFSALYQWQLNRFRYGMGVFKIDWALDGLVPFKAEVCNKAGTIHLGGTFEEIVHSEREIGKGNHVEKPFVLFAQQSRFDATRAPKGKHTAWAYCHVPNGSKEDKTTIIENQIERFAPGFKDLILAKHTMNTREMQVYNPNYIGGDINGGVIDIGQLFTRPALRSSPYRTSQKGLYLCSSSTPPGGGVHGMCGYHAAERAIKDLF